MKPYSEYSAEELAMERLFIRWVRYPNDPPIRSFWENWLMQHPQMNRTVETARDLVQAASAPQSDSLSREEAGSLWTKIRSSIEHLPDVEPLDPGLRSLAANLYFYRWSVGIVTTMVMVLFWFFMEPQRMPYQGLEQLTAKADTVQVKVPAADSVKRSGYFPHP
jgi:hypothetical protein